MEKPQLDALKKEGSVLGEAAVKMLRRNAGSIGESVKQAGVGFKEGTTANKLTVLGGISTGMTFTLTGLRTLRTGLAKDEKTGKRDYASAALGAAEFAGGAFVTALFWERMKMNAPDAGERSR